MPISMAALIAFAAWALLLLLAMAIARFHLVRRGALRPRDFVGGTPHGPDAYQRLVRAHANAVENLPIFGALVLVAALLRVESDAFTALAVAVVVARVGQTFAHLWSGSDRAVLVRAAFFSTQTVMQATMVFVLLAAAPW